MQTKRDQEAASDIFAKSIEAHAKLKAFEESIAYLSPRKKKVFMKAARKDMKSLHKKMWEDSQKAKLAAKETGAHCDSDSDTDDE